MPAAVSGLPANLLLWQGYPDAEPRGLILHAAQHSSCRLLMMFRLLPTNFELARMFHERRTTLHLLHFSSSKAA
jgi:hypothetical protein